MTVGDAVEWTIFDGSIENGVVTLVTERRVYVRVSRTITRGRGAGRRYNADVWWDLHELDALRVKLDRPA